MERYIESHRMRRWVRRLLLATCLGAWVPTCAVAQKTLTWEQAKRELETSNPTLRAARIGIQESRADEITALPAPQPGPDVSVDQFSPLSMPDTPYRPLTDTEPFLSGSYLIERRHKRNLRRESARQGTAIAISELDDQERNLLFDFRGAFVQVLQQKAVVAVTRESLEFYDRMLAVSRDRYKAGDIAQVDLDRLELQRVQFETDVQTALVNLRTAKIQLQTLLNDRTPVEQLDVSGRFDYAEILTPSGRIPAERIRFQGRILRAADASCRQGEDRLPAGRRQRFDRSHVRMGRRTRAAGSGLLSASASTIPLRIFDRNQGEKARTQLDIKRNERLVEANRAQVFSDVDSAYATLQSDLILLRPYKARVSAAGGARAGDDFVFVSAWRGLAAGFPAGTAGLPQHPTELSEPGGVFSERRQPNEFRGGT